MLIEGDRGYSYVRAEPPPAPPPAPRTDTVQNGDTVATVAQRNGVSAEHLAQANHITTETSLKLGQVLTIPTVATDRYERPPPKTPADRTDEAYTAYQQALQHRTDALSSAPKNAYERQEIGNTENAAVNQAKANLDAAVAAEITDRIAHVNKGVPPEYQTSPDSLITAYGDRILQRHANDPAATPVLTESINDYRLDRKADSLIPGFYGNVSPQEKLAQVNRSLQGQPPEVVERVMTDPRVQQMMKDAVNWVAEPYKNLSERDAGYDTRAAAEASKRLADLTANLPPAYAAQIVRESMPTITKIANVEANMGNLPSFTNLSRVVGSLGDSPEARALTSQIAQAYGNQFQKWEGFFGDTIKNSIADGASPKLALELATQLQAAGKTDQVRLVVFSVGRGAEALQGKLKQDMADYVEHTKDLNWLASNSKDKLTPDQLQKAIKEYIAGQGPEWQNKLRDIEGRITADAAALGETIGALKTLPGELNGLGAQALNGVGGKIGEDKATQSALAFALSKDPTLFKGKEGDATLGFLAEIGHNNKDLVNATAKAYISTQILPAVSNLNALDPASVAAANRALDKLQANGAKFLGVPQSEIDAGVDQLRKTVNTLQTTKLGAEGIDNVNALGQIKEDLKGVQDLRFSNLATGLAFRTVAFGLTAGNLINQTGKVIEDPSLQNVAGELAYAAGLAQDAAAFGATVKLLDKEGTLGKFGLGSADFSVGGIASRATERFIGLMNATYFAAGAVTEFTKDDVNIPAVAFNVTGATGALLGTFGEAAGLGAWTGPVGAAMVVVATAGVELVKYRTEINHNTDLAQKFLQGAGVNETAAKAMSSEALAQASQVQEQLGLTPEQLQEIAAKHPTIFQTPGHAQAAVDVAKACHIEGNEVLGFLDALAKDDPNYVQMLFDQNGKKNGKEPLTHQADLYGFVAHQSPTAAAYVRQHSPELVGRDADLRRQADRAYESANDRDPPTIANVMSSKSDPAFKAEIIKIMKDNGSLDSFVQEISTFSHYNGWPEAARDGIRAAESAGVLTSEQARSYLDKLG